MVKTALAMLVTVGALLMLGLIFASLPESEWWIGGICAVIIVVLLTTFLDRVDPATRIKGLAASDFPGIDEQKFSEWKMLQIKANLENKIVWVSVLALWFILDHVNLIKGHLYHSMSFIIWVCVAIGFSFIRTKRLRQLRKELKISDRLWAKKKGRAFAGL